jgi:hypothetical protein
MPAGQNWRGGGLRAANARLRAVVTSKDELLAGKDTLIEAQREQLGNYAETAARSFPFAAGDTFLTGTSAVSSARLKTSRRELTGVCV